MLKIRKKIELHNEQQLGLTYFENVGGQHYPVIAFFPESGQSEAAQDKIRYLINGENR